MIEKREKPLVSIIIPAHNNEDCILKCVDSILKNDYEELEILIIENGSTDRTWEVIESVEDARVKGIRLENAGVSRARNEGIRRAQGAYLMFVDADDEILTNTVSLLAERAFDTDADIIRYSGIERTGKMERRMEKNVRTEKCRKFSQKQITEMFIGKKAIYGSACLLFMKNREIVPFREDIRYLEDTLFCILNFRNKKVGFCEEMLYIYNRNEASATGNPQKAGEILHELGRGIEAIGQVLPESSRVLLGRWATFLYVSRLSYFAQTVKMQDFISLSRSLRVQLKNQGIWGTCTEDYPLYHKLFFLCADRSFDMGACLLARTKQGLAKTYLKVKNMRK